MIEKKFTENSIPEIGIYDRNGVVSGLNNFYSDALRNGIELYHADRLEYIKDCKRIIINPPCIVFKDTWKRIGEYINKNPSQEIFFFAPDNTPEEIEQFIGKPKNVKYLTLKTKEDIKVNWDLVYSLIGGRD